MMNRSKTLAFGLLAASLSLAVHAAGNPVRPNDLATRVSHAQAGRALTLPTQAAPAAVVSEYLRRKGHSDSTVRSLKLKSQSRGLRNNQVHLRLAQEIGGLPVYDTYVKATVNRRGELVSVIENLAPSPAGGVARPTIDEAAALAAAFRILKIPGTVPQVVGRSANETSFAKGRQFLEQPLVSRVAIPMSDGTMSTGFLVETWQRTGNRLHETLVNGHGGVVEVLGRTNSDSYHVFLADPEENPSQVTVPGAPGWLFPGNHRSIDIAGNNAHAYLDAINDSVPDAGGDTITDGNFLSVFDPGIQPSAGDNREVAVQNLFFLNNVIHDTLYAHGFDEGSGNFQEDNGGLGGRDGDSVNAEAQDGGGLDNANFATPRDGRNPRMQMYLWSSPDPDHEVVVSGGVNDSFGARGAVFGPALDATGISGEVVLADDDTVGGTENDACEPITNDVSGKVAMIDRGFCAFTIKVKNAQLAGAIGVIMVNNSAAEPIVMGGEDATITIPSLMISQADGAVVKGAASAVNATLRLLDPAPIMRDGDLDSDIVWHEYGHGLTWRMIGRMNGPLSGAIGEGMSDVLAIIANDDDIVGEYSFPGGIRSEPYANYTRSYGDIAGTGVHFDGEVYGAIGWRMWQNFQGAGVGKTTLMDYLVDGMHFTPAHPSFEDMRDGILASVTDAAHECLVWDAFADYGVGVGAKGSVRGSKVVITETFDRPAGCSPIP